MDSRRLGFVLGVVLGLCPSVAMQADGSEDEKPLYKDATPRWSVAWTTCCAA